jgi:hypothetical protein
MDYAVLSALHDRSTLQTVSHSFPVAPPSSFSACQNGHSLVQLCARTRSLFTCLQIARYWYKCAEIMGSVLWLIIWYWFYYIKPHSYSLTVVIIVPGITVFIWTICMVDTYTHAMLYMLLIKKTKLRFWSSELLFQFCRWYLKMEVASTSQIQSTSCYNPEKQSLKYHHTLRTSNLNLKSCFYKMIWLSISYSIYKIEKKKKIAATLLQRPPCPRHEANSLEKQPLCMVVICVNTYIH